MMDKRALIGPQSPPNHIASADNRNSFVFDYHGANHGNEKRKPKPEYVKDRNNQASSLDSGQGGHYIPSPFLNSPFPLPNSRIDGGSYTNPVFQDDYPQTPRMDKRRTNTKDWNAGIHGNKTRTDNGIPTNRGNVDRVRNFTNKDETDRIRHETSRNESARGEKSRDTVRSRETSPHRPLDDRSRDRVARRGEDAGHSRPSPLDNKKLSRDQTTDLERRSSRSTDRSRPRRSNKLRRSTRSLERTISSLSQRNRKYAELKSETDSDYQNGDYRSDNSLPPDGAIPLGRQPSITTMFSTRARAFIQRRIAERSSTPSLVSTLTSEVTEDSVFLDESCASAASDLSKRSLPVEAKITIENETSYCDGPLIPGPRTVIESPIKAEIALRTMEASPQHFTFDNIDDQLVMNGGVKKKSPTLTPAASDLDEDLPDVITSEDADDMIVMLLSNRSPCVAKLIAFCGIMQITSGFITMISGASGFLSDITVFDFKFKSPIAFWCGVLLVFSGGIGIKISHTKRRNINIFSAGISFASFFTALFVLVMTSDPSPIFECATETRVLYYSHLFLMNVAIMSSSVLCFMCLKSLMDSTSTQPNEVQVLKTLSKYGLQPEHSVPQMAAARAAAAAAAAAAKNSGPGTPSAKSPPKTPATAPAATRGRNQPRSDKVDTTKPRGTSTPKTEVRNAVARPEVRITEPEPEPKPEVVLTVHNGNVIQRPPDIWTNPEAQLSRSRDRRPSPQIRDRASSNQQTRQTNNALRRPFTIMRP